MYDLGRYVYINGMSTHVHVSVSNVHFFDVHAPIAGTNLLLNHFFLAKWRLQMDHSHVESGAVVPVPKYRTNPLTERLVLYLGLILENPARIGNTGRILQNSALRYKSLYAARLHACIALKKEITLWPPCFTERFLLHLYVVVAGVNTYRR